MITWATYRLPAGVTGHKPIHSLDFHGPRTLGTGSALSRKNRKRLMRHPAKLFVTGAAAFFVVSCNGDSTTYVRSTPPIIGNSPALAALTVPTSVDFVIPAAGGDVTLFGVYKLSVPANAVCDPNAQDTQAGYAAAAWDAPCTVTTSDQIVHATVKWSNNALWVDFSPALRFDPNATVTLSTGILAPLVSYYGPGSHGMNVPFRYAYSIDGTSVADAGADATLHGYANLTTGTVSRRVKHFSGYQITGGANAGQPCNPEDGNPDCVWVDDGHGG